MLGLDAAITLTAVGRVLNSLAGLGSTFLVALRLTKVEQGYFVTFNSVLAMQVFFELGLSTVVLHAASHEVALLALDETGRFQGDAESKRRLADLLQIATRCYAGIALLLAAILLPIGFRFFAYDPNASVVQWRLPWVLTVVFTACFIPLSGVTAFIEGCGAITEAARIRLWQGVCANVMLFTVLILGGRLFASSWGAATQAGVACLWLAVRHRRKLLDLWRLRPVQGAIDWWRQIWPFQWRMAVSWVSGYFIYQLFTPVLFQEQGASAAGRFGLTLAVISGIGNVATSWITAKVPRFGALIATRRFEELDALYAAAVKRVVGITALFGCGFWAVIELLRLRGVPLADRFADGPTLAMLVVAASAMNFSFSMASYLRSHKREPYLWSSLALGAANAAMALLLAKPFGARGIAAGYLATSLVIAVGVGYAIFVAKRAEWHAEAA